ncbi:MAG: cytidine deaminase, partial [Atopobium sp.]|nr:cytidine deaminase [Atopobium sp.]
MAEVEGSCHVSNEALVQLAIEARNHAYVPYSHYAVGAALLCSDGTVYGGANLENAAYTPSNCAERTAFFRAVFE